MEYDKTRFVAMTRKDRRMLHWILNPAVMINELLLGQRMPKMLLIDQISDKPLEEIQFVPCPHCGKVHDGRLWSKENGFKNWFGYYCPDCGNIIPCLRNLTSLLVIILTVPVWIWFAERWKQNWLKKQPARFENFKIEEITYKDAPWLKMSLAWGGGMFLLMTVILPVIQGKAITLTIILIGIPVWGVAGLIAGYIMKKVMDRHRKKIILSREQVEQE